MPIGDEPIEQRHHEIMNQLAVLLDLMFNGEARGEDRTTGFVLMVFDFGIGTHRCNYISNCDRVDIITLMKEQIKRFEGQPDMEGHA